MARCSVCLQTNLKKIKNIHLIRILYALVTQVQYFQKTFDEFKKRQCMLLKIEYNNISLIVLKIKWTVTSIYKFYLKERGFCLRLI